MFHFTQPSEARMAAQLAAQTAVTKQLAAEVGELRRALHAVVDSIEVVEAERDELRRQVKSLQARVVERRWFGRAERSKASKC
jgi:uncharacterized coiled-coil DUF342 family protein